MDEFIKQLSTFVPLVASIINELESNLSQVENEIRTCKAKITRSESLLQTDKVIEDYLSQNTPKFKQCLLALGATIRSVDKIRSGFARFECETLDFKKCKFAEISQMINDYMASTRSSIIQFSSLSEEIKERLKKYYAETVDGSADYDQVELKTLLLEAELNERNRFYSNLSERFLHLNKILVEKEQELRAEELERNRKESYHQKVHQEHVVLEHNIKMQNSKLTELKSQIRRFIFEYLNKVKLLDNLTKTRKQKMVEFKNLFLNYSKEGVARLIEKRSYLEAELAAFDKIDDNVENKKFKDENGSLKSKKDLQVDENVRFCQRLRSKKLENHVIDKLKYLDHLYNRLINSYDTRIGEKTVDDVIASPSKENEKTRP